LHGGTPDSVEHGAILPVTLSGFNMIPLITLNETRPADWLLTVKKSRFKQS
jgi:hypothetical protein